MPRPGEWTAVRPFGSAERLGLLQCNSSTGFVAVFLLVHKAVISKSAPLDASFEVCG
jgi:hypothetical protein